MDLGSLLGRLVPRARGAGGAAGGTASASAPVAQLAVGAAPALTGAWRQVPALRPTVGEAPLVAPTPPFRAGLAAARPAPVALGALGHGHGLEAPSGLASGVAVPVARTPSEPVPVTVRRAAVQRRSADGADHPWTDVLSGGDDAVSTMSPDAALPAAAPIPPGGIEASTAGSRQASPLITAPHVAPVPAGRLGSTAPVIARDGASEAPGGLSREPVADTGGASARGLATADAWAAPSPAAGPVAPTSRGGPLVERLAVGAPPAATIGTSPGAAATASSSAATGPGARAPLASAPGRRLHVGPPLTLPPAARHPEPAAAAHDRDAPAAIPSPSAAAVVGAVQPGAPRPRGAAAQRAVDGAANEDSIVAAPEHGGEGTLLAGGRETSPAPSAPVAWSATAPTPAATPAGARRGSVVWRGGIDAVAASPLVGTLRPTLDAAPPAVAVHREAAAVEPGEPEAAPGTPSAALAALARADPSGAFGDGPTSAGVQWASGASSSSVAPPTLARLVDGDASPFTIAPAADAGVSAPRLTWTNPWFSGEAAASPTVPASGPAGAAGSSPDAAHPSAGHRAGAVARVSGVGATSGVAVSRQAAADARGQLPAGFAPRPSVLRIGPAVQASAASSVAAGSASDTPATAAARDASPHVARATDTAAPAISLAPLQRVDAATEAAPDAGPAAAAPAAGAPGATGGPAQDRELDELARRLYDRIGGRLRRDLLVERERAGTLVDRGF